MSCFGDLIDSSDDNSGLLKVNEDYFLVRGDNKQLPIKDGTGFRFVEITKINTKMLTPTKFVFQPLFEAAALDLIAKGGDVTGLTVQVLVSWKQNDGYRTQKFVYNDDLLTQFLGSYNAATGKYGKMFTLTLNNVDGIEELSFAAVLASSTKVTISSNDPVEEETEEIFSASTNLNKNDLIYGTLANEVTLSGTTGVSAVVPAAVKVENGAATLALSVKKAETGSEITLGEGESAQSLDVHIAGVAADNKVPMIVNLGAILEKGLSDTELKLYHTENGVAVLMTRVASAADFAIHNQYTYNPKTGEVSIYVASFSVFSAVQATVDKWEDPADISWYNENDTEFTLTTAEQFEGFRYLVDAGNTFEGKTVKLGVDIDLAGKPFNPIGRDYVHLGGQAFMGTFDGANHTIYNLYQNGWELGDSYNTAGGGLFASIKDATIKNLAVSGANIVFECVDMGIVVGYAQGYCTFENIVVTNSKIANYNRSTGGVVGEVCMGTEKLDANKGKYTHTFRNITVDSSVTVSSLWGSFDTSCGGVIGGKWDNTGWDPVSVYMENITVAAKLDVFSDVTAAYQWYAYRRCGMLIGYTEQESPKKAWNAAADFLTCSDVEVYYGDWVNYHYYEFENQESSTGRNYPWVRAEEGLNNAAFSNPRYGVPTHNNGIKVTEDPEFAQRFTDYTPIVFGQLYGGGQGVYGCAEHDGVKTYDKTAKTIYIVNDQNWENLKLQYWFKNGDDIWSTMIDGIDMSTMYQSGAYKVELPLYAYGFKITGDNDKTTADLVVADVVENLVYNLEGEHIDHKFSNGKCACGKELEKGQAALVTDIQEIMDGGEFVIVVKVDDKYYALGNEYKAGKTDRIVAPEVTVLDDIIMNTDAPSWTVVIKDEKATLKNNNHYLGFESGTTNLNLVNGEGDNAIWAITSKNNGAFWLTDDDRSAAYRTGAEFEAFRFYKNTNATTAGYYFDLYFFEKVVCSHENKVDREAVAATCTTVGYTAGTQCVDCGIWISGHDEIAATDHSYSGEVTTEPGCETTGEKTYTCSKCEDSYTEEIAATGHNYDEGVVTTPATCVADGVKTYTCTCGNSYTEIIEKLNHNYVDGVCTGCGAENLDDKGVTIKFSVPNGVDTPEDQTSKDGLPGLDTFNGYDFVGWVTYEITIETTNAPAKIYKAGDLYDGDADVTLYAVYKRTEAGEAGFVKTDIEDIPTDAVVVITMKNSNGTYAMSNSNGASSAPAAVSVTISGNKLDAKVASNIQWTIKKDGNNISFYKGSTALYCTSTNNGVRVGTNTANKFVIDATTGYLKHNGTGRYIGVYNNADWRCYTSVNTNIQNQTLAFYVETASSEATYYITEIPCKHANTTTTTVDATCTVAGSETVTCDDCEAVISETEIPVIDHTYVDGTCSCGATDPNAGGTTPAEPTLKLEITKDDFTTVSYDDNNRDHTDNGYTFKSNQVMNQQGAMQWQKSKGYITIENNPFVKLEIKVTAGTFTVTVGGKTVTGTTTNGVTTYDLTGLTGEIKISVGSATGKVDYLKFYK